MTRGPVDAKLFEVEGVAEPPPKVPAGADKTFRHYDPHQSFLLPPSLDDWLPELHVARFIAEVVDDMLDLTEIYDSYESAAGAPPYENLPVTPINAQTASGSVTTS